MDERDRKEIVRLAREGKLLSRIQEDNFPDYDYEEIYWAANESGEKSALGVKRTITNRLNELYSTTSSSEQREIINEINFLVTFLYQRLQENQKKLDSIRQIINQ